MVTLRGFVLAFLAVVASASRARVSPVQKVSQLLADLITKVEKDLDAQARTFEEYAQHCDKDADEQTRSIADSKATIEDLDGVIKNAKATIQSVDSEIQDVTDRIASSEGEFKEAASIRSKGHAQFVANEKELVDSVSSLSRAAASIKKGISFTQLSARQKAGVSAALRALEQVISAASMPTAHMAKLQALLEQQEDAEDGADFSEGQEPAEGEEQSSSGIVDTISDMEDKAQNTLTDVRKAEMKGQHTFEMLKAGTERELESLKKELGESTAKKQSTSEELAAAMKELSMETKSMHTTSSYLADLKHECQEKAATFELEMRDGKAELAALQKATQILNEKFSFSQDGQAPSVSVLFLQTNQRTTLHSRARSRMASGMRMRGMEYGDDSGESSDFDDRRMAAMHYLDHLGRQLKSTALVSLAYRTGSDPFSKIKGMLEEMIEKLLQEAAQEADQKAFCDKELGESKASMQDKSEKLDTISARMGKAEALVGRLTSEVADLRGEVTDLDASVSNSTKLRIQEKEEFRVAEKEFTQSEEACTAAIQVLREYYEGGSSFLQLKSTTRLRSKARARARLEDGVDTSTMGGEAIVGLLEVAASDFAKMLAEAKANENMAQEEFTKDMTDARVLKATKLTDLKAKESEIKMLQTTLDNQASDKEGIAAELNAVMEYMDRLKPECETKVPSYAEQKARREQEIEGLKNALSILDGTGVPGLLQKRALPRSALRGM